MPFAGGILNALRGGIGRLNQSEPSISTIWTNESAPLCEALRQAGADRVVAVRTPCPPPPLLLLTRRYRAAANISPGFSSIYSLYFNGYFLSEPSQLWKNCLRKFYLVYPALIMLELEDRNQAVTPFTATGKALTFQRHLQNLFQKTLGGNKKFMWL